MNKNKPFIFLMLIVLFGLGIYLSFLNKTPVSVGFDPKNATYEIEEESFTLVDGKAETEIAPNSASKIITRYFGNEAVGDLDFDGRPDMAYLITQEGGGTGIFFFAVVALNKEEGYKLTNTFFVGDRIAPQSTNIIANELHVNFAMRRPDEPFTTSPSQGAVLLLKVTPEGVLEGLMK